MTSRAIAPTSNGKKAFSRLDIPMMVPGVMDGTGTTADRQLRMTMTDGLTNRSDWLDLSLNNCMLAIRMGLLLSIGIRDDRLTEIREAIA